ncbi:MAG: hypothetical protein AB1847_22075, partial [bacterium]
MKNKVYIARTAPRYDQFPYSDNNHAVFAAFCDLWSAWGCDPADPFRNWVGPGGCVVIKPNWVMEYNPLGYDLE